MGIVWWRMDGCRLLFRGSAICGAGGGFRVGMAAIRHVLSLKLLYPFCHALFLQERESGGWAAHINRQGNKIAAVFKVQAAFRIFRLPETVVLSEQARDWFASECKMQPAHHASRIKHPFGQQHDADHVAEHAQMNQLEMTAAEFAATAQGHSGEKVAEHAQCQQDFERKHNAEGG